MACYHPIPALQYGSEPPRLWPPRGTANLELPCGTCLGCKTARAAAWATRCDHEASSWANNVFITLTYDDAHLPPDGHLDETALTLFLKKTRERARRRDPSLRTDKGGNVKYLACGEYGEQGDRPHYHACLFNLGFTDRQRVGKDLYESELLSQLWGKGKATYSDYNGARANYIAQYTLKKQGNHNDHDADGVWRPAPFLRVSTRPGIGYSWLDKYREDLRGGFITTRNGQQVSIPRTYRERLKLHDPHLAEEIAVKAAHHRLNKGGDNRDQTTEGREAAERIHRRKKELTENRKL